MQIKENFPLQKLNTFSVNVLSKYFVEIESYSEIDEIINWIYEEKLPFIILGEGSNILFTKDYEGIIIKYIPSLIEIIDEKEDKIFVKVQSGCLWDEFVKWSVEQKLWGVENLSLIPGTVGAAPVQNIGAYGVEVKDCIDFIEFHNFENKETKIYSKDECLFGYRDSIFKNQLKNKGIITSVVFELNKLESPNLSYSDLMRLENISINNIRDEIIRIRENKLPNPKEIGNNGSFFKNPIVSKEIFNKLKMNYPEIPSYRIDEEKIKIPAAWLIEKTEIRIHETENVGLYEKHSLIIINKNNASGKEILKFAKLIQKLVFDKFKIELEFEVNIL